MNFSDIEGDLSKSSTLELYYSKQTNHMDYLKNQQFEAHLRSKYKITVEELKQLVKENYPERLI